jgi:hypothetical protein
MSSERQRSRWRDGAAVFLTIVGCLQMTGYLVGSDILRGIGAATAASPFPRVFSDIDGLETFASEFTLRYRDPGGSSVALEITPQVYGRLGGPYNRRNVYGAALSYAPRLPVSLWQSVFCYALAPDGPLRSELGLGSGASDFEVIIRTRTRGRNDMWTLDPPCAP